MLQMLSIHPQKRNALQLEKNTCKLRKHFRQFDNAHAANAHNTTKKKKRAANRKKHLQIKETLSSIWQRTRCKRSQHNQKKKRAANRKKKTPAN